MASFTSTQIYLADLAIIDTNEAANNGTGENPGAVVGKTFASGGALPPALVSVTYNDLNGNGAVDEDTNYFSDGSILSSGQTESLTFDTGSGPTTSVLDYVAIVNVTVTENDGTVTSGRAVLQQTQSGDTFLREFDAILSNKDIASIRVDSIDADQFNGDAANLPSITGTNFVCFTAGTRIATPEGDVPVERLKVGDLVLTQDSGPQPIRWVRGSVAPRSGRLRPIRIAQGALGSGKPKADLVVSQQHRMLVRSPIAQRMFDADEVLVAAKNLTCIPGIAIEEAEGNVEYWHFLLDRHEIVFAEGAPSESLLPGPFALDAMGPEARSEVLALFPELATRDARERTARPIPQPERQERLARRHVKNAKPLLGKPRCAPRALASLPAEPA